MSTAAARASPNAPIALDVFIVRAEARAMLWDAGELDLHTAVDELWERKNRLRAISPAVMHQDNRTVLCLIEDTLDDGIAVRRSIPVLRINTPEDGLKAQVGSQERPFVGKHAGGK